MPDENPESILPDEVVREITAAVRKALAPDSEAKIGAKAALTATAEVIRPKMVASSQSFAAVTVRLVGIPSAEAFGSLGLQLSDPVESKKFWNSAIGHKIKATIIELIIHFIVAGALCLHEEDTISSLATKVEKQFEEFWLSHQPKPGPTPQPDPAPKHAKKRNKARGKKSGNHR